jgi:hypothetical protein
MLSVNLKNSKNLMQMNVLNEDLGLTSRTEAEGRQVETPGHCLPDAEAGQRCILPFEI